MNPQGVLFDPDEVDRVMRVRMARWMNISPLEWDALSYLDQCDALEIARAEKAIAEYDAAKRFGI